VQLVRDAVEDGKDHSEPISAATGTRLRALVERAEHEKVEATVLRHVQDIVREPFEERRGHRTGAHMENQHQVKQQREPEDQKTPLPAHEDSPAKRAGNRNLFRAGTDT